MTSSPAQNKVRLTFKYFVDSDCLGQNDTQKISEIPIQETSNEETKQKDDDDELFEPGSDKEDNPEPVKEIELKKNKGK